MAVDLITSVNYERQPRQRLGPRCCRRCVCNWRPLLRLLLLARLAAVLHRACTPIAHVFAAPQTRRVPCPRLHKKCSQAAAPPPQFVREEARAVFCASLLLLLRMRTTIASPRRCCRTPKNTVPNCRRLPTARDSSFLPLVAFARRILDVSADARGNAKVQIVSLLQRRRATAWQVVLSSVPSRALRPSYFAAGAPQCGADNAADRPPGSRMMRAYERARSPTRC